MERLNTRELSRIQKLIAAGQKWVMRDPKGFVGAGVGIRRASVRIWKKVHMSIFFGAIFCCLLWGRHPKFEKCSINSFSRDFRGHIVYRWSLHHVHSLNNFDSNGCIWKKIIVQFGQVREKHIKLQSRGRKLNVHIDPDIISELSSDFNCILSVDMFMS